MALTQALLKSFGLEADQRDAIMTEHQATLESIKAERDELRDKAAKVPDLERQIQELKAADEGDALKAERDELQGKLDQLQADNDRLKGEKDTLNAEYEAYRQQVDTDKSNAVKLELYKGLLREIGLDEKRVDKAARLKKLDELTVEDGKLAGYDELKQAEAEEWSVFIPQPQGIKGQDVPGAGGNPKPPQPAGDQPNERAVQIARERHEKLYGKSEE